MKRFREFLKLAERFRSCPIVDDDFPAIRDQFDSEHRLLLRKEIPEVVCLCGSTRFGDAYSQAMKNLTLQGKIVLTVGLLGHQENLDMNGQIKSNLDKLHKRKIDISDRVLVLNVGGYIGDSTRSEVEYAEQIGVPVDYLEPI